MIYNLLKAKVDNRNRLLVTPHIIRSRQGERRGFRHYFGDNSVYVEDCVGSLEEFIETMQIRYIVYTTFDNKSLTREPVCYNLKKEEYTLDKEINLLRSFQNSRTFKYLLRENEITIIELIDTLSLPNK